MKPDPVLDYESLSAGPRTYSYLTVAKWCSLATAASLCLMGILGPLAVIAALVSAYSGAHFAYRAMKHRRESRSIALALLTFNLLVAASPLILIVVAGIVAKLHGK
jgi:4-hydroxybenzoate polyprenyltransferase